MPLPELSLPAADTIPQYRLAAENRFFDGLAAAVEGQRAGAVYLWGYVAELLAKVGYFSHVEGYADSHIFTQADRDNARERGRQEFGIHWPGRHSGHNVSAWLQLLVRARDATPGKSYPRPGFGDEVLTHGDTFRACWSVDLRYHGSIPDAGTVEDVRQAVEWLFDHRHEL